MPNELKGGNQAKRPVTMLDMSMFREHADVVRADHDRRGLAHDAIDEVIRLDEAWRKAQYDADHCEGSATKQPAE